MVSSGHTSTLSRKRIRANGQERKNGDTPEAPPEEETTVASRADVVPVMWPAFVT